MHMRWHARDRMDLPPLVQSPACSQNGSDRLEPPACPTNQQRIVCSSQIL